MPTLHVVMPFYNEPETIRPCIERVVNAPLPPDWTLDLVLVDDHSDEAGKRAGEAAAAFARNAAEPGGGHVALLRHEPDNLGKGAALRTGFDAVLQRNPPDEDIVIVQDADLEYDPADYAALLESFLTDRERVVYGTRWGEHHRAADATQRLHRAGNRLITRISNLLTGYRVTDMECCYKLLPIPVLREVRPMLTENRFGVEPQLTAALARLGVPICEVPVRYEPRGFSAGKKIGWIDAVRALYVMLRERLRGRPKRRPDENRGGGLDRSPDRTGGEEAT